MKRSRPRSGDRSRSRPTHGRGRLVRRPVPASILARITSDPAGVVTALCQMATLAHVAGRLKKRNESVNVAADLLAFRRRISQRTGNSVAINRFSS